MKKLVTIMVVALMSISAWALTEVVNGITWNYSVSNGKATINQTKISGEVVIPSTLSGCPVTSIVGYAFEGCSGLTSITIPEGVTSIGNAAFKGCSSLTSIVIPDGVTSISGYAFQGCSGLTSIVIPDSVTIIGDRAFEGCSGLTSIVIPDSVTSIGYYAFSGCSSLTSLLIPDGVTSIGDRVFSGCSGLTSVVIPDGVTSIGNDAFSGCSGLTSVVIPDSVTSIGNSAFWGCSSLTSIVIPDSVTSIGNAAFRWCSGLTSIVIPDSVTSIGGSAFQDCRGLTSVTIGNGVTSIGNNAFGWCSSLTEIIFKGAVPNGLNSSYSSAPILFSQEFGASWMQFVATNSNTTVAGLNIDYDEDYFLDVEIISAKMREDNPTIMDIKYKVVSSNDFVNVRVLAFEDGERSFAKVIRPETFVDNTSVSVGDKVAANVEHTISWQVSSDWDIDLAKVKFEVLAKNVNDYLLPLDLITIPATKEKPAMQVSWNFIHIKHVENALYWLYASNDADLTLSNGVLKNGSIQLVSNGALKRNTATIEFLFSKMGYNLLSGDNLTYARSATRKALPTECNVYFKQYAVKIIEE